ncbi:MAG: BACON domain-containing protein [Candidatus Cryptobacteroides sp.]
MKRGLILTALSAVFGFSACSSSSDDVLITPGDKYATEGVVIPADGGKVSFTYNITGMSGGEKVSAVSDASWLGSFETSTIGIVSFTAEYNDGEEPRETSVTVSCKGSEFSIKAVQASHAKPSFEVMDEFGLETNAAGGNGYIVFKIKNVDPRGKLEISTDSEWISEFSHNPIIKEGVADTLSLFAVSNNGSSTRSGKVTLTYTTPDNTVTEEFTVSQEAKEYDIEFAAKLISGWYYGRSTIKDGNGAVAPGPEKNYNFYFQDRPSENGRLAFLGTNFGVSLLSLTVPSEEEMDLSTIPIPPATYKFDSFSEGVSGKQDCFGSGYTGYYYYSSTVADDYSAVHRSYYKGGTLTVTKHGDNFYECELIVDFLLSWYDENGQFHEDGYIHMDGQKNARAVYRGKVGLIDHSDGM